jgi:hypothetical protein
MINFRLEIRNPWSKDRFKNLGSISGRISKNKAWELEHTFYDGMLLDFDFNFTTRKDHAGLDIVLGLLTYGIHFQIYDTRHWDYENQKWVDHG